MLQWFSPSFNRITAMSQLAIRFRCDQSTSNSLRHRQKTVAWWKLGEKRQSAFAAASSALDRQRQGKLV